MTKLHKRMIDDIVIGLKTNRKLLEESIVLVYKASNVKGYGFQSQDRKRLTVYAIHIINGGHLTGEHLILASSKMPKYAEQILELQEKCQ